MMNYSQSNLRKLYISNINPYNYTALNYIYDYFSKTQNLKPIEIPRVVFGIDVENYDTLRFDVIKYKLPHNNYVWFISSNKFKHYYAFLLNPVVKDEEIIMGGIKYYKNRCIKCGKVTTSFAPLPKISYGGYENAVYLCPHCNHVVVKRFESQSESRKNMPPNKLEREIQNILDEIDVPYEREKSFNLGYMTKIADFYIPCANLIIEGNGLAYHSNLIKTKSGSRFGKEAFFVNVMKDIVAAYELLSKGYQVYIITEADLIDYDDIHKISEISPKNLSPSKIEFLKNDLEELLTLNGCKIRKGFSVWNQKF